MKEGELYKHIYAGVLYERPDFGPRQVRSSEELEIGKRYIRHYKYYRLTKEQQLQELKSWPFRNYTGVERTTEFKITALPDPKEKSPRVKVAYKVKGSTGERIIEDSMSLRDLGIEPYPGGLWHRNAWLEDPSK